MIRLDLGNSKQLQHAIMYIDPFQVSHWHIKGVERRINSFLNRFPDYIYILTEDDKK